MSPGFHMMTGGVKETAQGAQLLAEGLARTQQPVSRVHLSPLHSALQDLVELGASQTILPRDRVGSLLRRSAEPHEGFHQPVRLR